MLVVAALVIVVALVAVLPSCWRTKSTPVVQDAHKAHVDSVLSQVKDVDSLATCARQAHERGDAVTEMLALKHQGKLLSVLLRHGEAIAALTDCYEIATQLADTIEMVSALNNVGSIYFHKGDLDKGDEYLYQALHLSDCFSDKDSESALKVRAWVMGNIASIEMEMYNFSFADSIMRQSLATEERLGNHLGMAINYRNLGIIKQYTGQNDSAWIYLKKSMECSQLINDERCMALCHLHFGDMHVEERRFSHAIEEYKTAHAKFKELNDSRNSLDAALALARVYVLLGEDAEANQYLNEAEAEVQRVGSKKFQSEASMLRYELSLMNGNTREALEHYIRGTAILDSIHGMVPQSGDMLDRHIDYERGRSSGEVDVLNRDISKLKRLSKMQRILSLVLLLMLLGIIGALAYAIRVRMRTQRLMRQVEETRSLFFTNVVHQLRTPLTAIMGSIDNMMLRGQSQLPGYVEEQRHDAKVIERQGHNLLTLVDRILEVGSVRSAIKDPEWRRGDAVALIRMIIERYRDMCSSRHIELAYAPREASVDIVIVPRYLTTIIGNLLENAISYSNDYGKIRITTSVENGHLSIGVTDDGIGISKTDLPHVFEPFYRGATAEQLVDGIGIGLTVVRDMAMAMGGSVAVESEKNQGATFTVELPCHRGGVVERFEQVVMPLRNLPLRKKHADLSAPQVENAGDKPVALVVEDQNDVARLVGLALSDICVVHYATDGEQGLAKACGLLPDLIVTDMKMPLMDGLEMLRLLRKHEQLWHIPVIMLSARTSDNDRIRGIETGADAYLLKPFVRDELLAWAKRLLDSRRTMLFHQQEASSPVQDDQPVTSTTDKTSDDNNFLALFRQELDKQLASGNKVDLDTIAIKLKMGETQMRHKLQELTGKNVPACVTQFRMEKAMRLLQDCPDCLIGDIAEQCGFHDVAYFSRVFRQYYGMTPTQARNQ